MPPRLSWSIVSVLSSHWLSELPSLNIGVLSDLHIGAPGMRPARARQIAEALNDRKPDIIFLLGDYLIDFVLGGRFVEPNEVVDILSILQAPLGVYAIMGNHEYLAPQAMRDAFARSHITLLENDVADVDVAGTSVAIGGLSDHRILKPDPRVVQQKANGRPLIVMGHDPAVVRSSGLKAALRLAGHLHAGQIRLPGIGALWVPGPTPRKRAYGLFEEEDGPLYISSGIGNSVLPIRIGAPSEIVLIDLKAA